MPDSIREQIVDAFSARISAARSTQLDGSSDLPARALWDSTESAERLQYGKMRLTMDVNVGFMDAVDKNVSNSEQGNSMLAELLEDALNSDPTMGGLCSQINYIESTIDYPEPGQDEIAILAAFQIVYETDSTSPFTA
ncbi:hypothetical protein [Marinobacter salarius]|uniref:hypothetical protein n=1 Tax=Marinobacter salarius TaxID=1420917 RepID=UPI003BA93D36